MANDQHGQSYIKARVTVAPENGAANAALEALIAKALKLAKSRVRVISGHTARMKTLEIDGASEAEIAALMQRLAG